MAQSLPQVVLSGVRARRSCPRVEETCPEVKTAAGRGRTASSAKSTLNSCARDRSSVPGHARIRQIREQEAGSLRQDLKSARARCVVGPFSPTGKTSDLALGSASGNSRTWRRKSVLIMRKNTSGNGRTRRGALTRIRCSESGFTTVVRPLRAGDGLRSNTSKPWKRSRAGARSAAACRSRTASRPRASCMQIMIMSRAHGATSCARGAIKGWAASETTLSCSAWRQTTCSGTGRTR